MSGAYRVEIASTARAGCSNTTCKNEGLKIPKGELRQGVSVTIKEHTSMKWRHWGCVTPAVLHNWKETSGGDMDLVDGYEELPNHAKERVKRALENEHVDDDDWNGDAEMNRYDPANPKQGMYSKATKAKEKEKKKAEREGATHEDDESPKPNKRSRKQVDEDEDNEEKPAIKKSRAKKAKNEDEEAIKTPAKKTKKKTAAMSADSKDVDDEEAPVAKKSRAKKPKSTAAVEASGDAEEPLDDEPKKPAAKGKKATAKAAKSDDADAPKQAPKRKGRGKKAPVEDE